MAAGRTVPVAATHIYQMSFFTGFGVSAIIYCLLNYLFPAAGSHIGAHLDERDVSEHVEPEGEFDDGGLEKTADLKNGDILVYGM